MNILACHLLNDFSGSPKVLMQLANGWLSNNHSVTIITGKNREGFLSGIRGANYRYFQYTFSSNILLRLFHFIKSQLQLFLILLRVANKNDLIYVNTVLPFGAALAGKLKGCRVIYHLHETSVKPALLKKFLFGVTKWCASEIIYVSQFLSETEKMDANKIHVLHNAIEDSFLLKARAFRLKLQPEKNVLMICSLKAYKGVNEFLDIAKRKPDYSFRLIVNATETDIAQFFINTKIPENVKILPTQTNTHPHYQWADVVMNLSRPDEWVETFGLTIIEAMSYGLPVIVPPVGGITELVGEGFNGFRINSSDIAHIAYKLSEILEDETTYNAMRKAALYKIGYYREETFILRNMAILTREKEVKNVNSVLIKAHN